MFKDLLAFLLQELPLIKQFYGDPDVILRTTLENEIIYIPRDKFLQRTISRIEGSSPFLECAPFCVNYVDTTLENKKIISYLHNFNFLYFIKIPKFNKIYMRIYHKTSLHIVYVAVELHSNTFNNFEFSFHFFLFHFDN